MNYPQIHLPDGYPVKALPPFDLPRPSAPFELPKGLLLCIWSTTGFALALTLTGRSLWLITLLGPLSVWMTYYRFWGYQEQRAKYREACLEYRQGKADHEKLQTEIERRLRVILQPLPGGNGKLGRSEKPFRDYLRRHFEYVLLDHYIQHGPNTQGGKDEGRYYPDAVILLGGLHLAIEIDEPYRLREPREPIHCEGQDDKRNKTFTDNGWIVIRFAEEQVARWPDQCCQQIRLFASYAKGEELSYAVPEMPSWDIATAQKMLQEDYRNTYLGEELRYEKDLDYPYNDKTALEQLINQLAEERGKQPVKEDQGPNYAKNRSQRLKDNIKKGITSGQLNPRSDRYRSMFNEMLSLGRIKANDAMARYKEHLEAYRNATKKK